MKSFLGVLLFFIGASCCHSPSYYRNALSVVQLTRTAEFGDRSRFQLYTRYQAISRGARPNTVLAIIVQEKYRNFFANTVANLDRMNIKKWIEDTSDNSVLDWQCNNDRSKLLIEFPQEVLDLLNLNKKELSRCASLSTFSRRSSCYMEFLKRSLPIEQALYAHNALSAYQQLRHLEFDYGLPDILTFLNTPNLNKRLLMMKVIMLQMSVLDYFTTFPLVASVFYGLEYLRHLAYLSGNINWLTNMQETSAHFESEVLAELVPHIYPKMVRVVYEEKLARPVGILNFVGVRIRTVPCRELKREVRAMRVVSYGNIGQQYVMEMTLPILHGIAPDIQSEILYVKKHCIQYCF